MKKPEVGEAIFFSILYFYPPNFLIVLTDVVEVIVVMIETKKVTIEAVIVLIMLMVVIVMVLVLL